MSVDLFFGLWVGDGGQIDRLCHQIISHTHVCIYIYIHIHTMESTNPAGSSPLSRSRSAAGRVSRPKGRVVAATCWKKKEEEEACVEEEGSQAIWPVYPSWMGRAGRPSAVGSGFGVGGLVGFG